MAQSLIMIHAVCRNGFQPAMGWYDDRSGQYWAASLPDGSGSAAILFAGFLGLGCWVPFELSAGGGIWSRKMQPMRRFPQRHISPLQKTGRASLLVKIEETPCCRKTYEASSTVESMTRSPHQDEPPEATEPRLNKAFWNECPPLSAIIDMECACPAASVICPPASILGRMDLPSSAQARWQETVRSLRRSEAFRSNIRQIQSSFNCAEEPAYALLFGPSRAESSGGRHDMISAATFAVHERNAFLHGSWKPISR